MHYSRRRSRTAPAADLLALAAGAVIIAVLSTACGRECGLPTTERPDPADFNLPPPSALAKDLSYTDLDRFRYGKDFESLLPTSRIAPEEHRLLFSPRSAPDDIRLAYAFFSFPLEGYDDEPTLAYEWQAPPVNPHSYWLGLARWEWNTWQWFEGERYGSLTFSTMDPYLNEDGTLLAVIVVVDISEAIMDREFNALEYVRVGPRIGEWVVETVDNKTQVLCVSLALDANDIPHIAYNDSEPGDTAIMYATLHTNWASQVVDDFGVFEEWPDLVLNDSGMPRICYRNATDNCLWLATAVDHVWGEWLWDWEYEALPNENAHSGSIVLDSENQPLLCFYDSGLHSLSYTRFNGVIWLTQPVDDDGDVGFAASLALDGEGNPCVSYYDLGNEALKYSYSTGISWETNIIDDSTAAGLPNSLAIDGLGRAQVSYFDTTNELVKWAYFDGHAWFRETVPDYSAHGEANSLAVDADNQPHISYMELTDMSLKYARLVNSSWQISKIDIGGSHVNAYSTAIALDSLGRPRIAFGGYSDPDERTLKYAYLME